ncbi:TolC family outer membrane protein [Zooshikella harenae]|uniref:TolC family outer membrane protein n=1 Tax=Zooshikella harenae TaxID=2827238 RepID=A0ABS5Z9Z2_9GAMM|nr:TolC family outer membrane protein [Zooshikella harenae]MBU2710872.1 TolC family outer membrane protein [Zooshikella harenae]
MRKRRSPKWFLVTALVLVPLSSFADEPLNLMEVYQLALENDAEFAAAKAALKAGEELDDQGRSQLLPKISASANTQKTKQHLLDANDLASTDRTSSYNSHGWSATLRQPLFDLSKWFSYTRSKVLTEQAQHQFQLELQKLILRVAEAYFDVLRAQDTLATAKAKEAAFKRQYDQAEQRFEVGLVAKTDVLEAKASYDTARVDRIVAENDVDVSLEKLRTITGNYISSIGKLDKQMPVKTPIPNRSKDWVDNAMTQNLDIKVARDSVRAAEELLRQNKSGHAPTVNAIAQYDHTAGASSNTSIDDFSGKSNTTVYKLQVDLPIFSGGLTSSQVRESTHKLTQAQKQEEFAQRSAFQDTRNLFNTIVADVQKVDARWQSTISSTSALEATESGYEVGTRNIIDVLQAQQVLYNSQRDYLNARYDYIINSLRLRRAAGTLDERDLKTLNNWVTKKQNTELLPPLNYQ